mgnify:FL=1
MKMSNIFTRHPNDNGLTYVGHLKRAMKVSVLLLVAALVAIVHAFFPFILKKFTGETVDSISELLHTR